MLSATTTKKVQRKTKIQIYSLPALEAGVFCSEPNINQSESDLELS